MSATKSTDRGALWLLLAITVFLVGLVCLVIGHFDQLDNACEEAGGTTVRTNHGYTCAKLEVIHVD